MARLPCLTRLSYFLSAPPIDWQLYDDPFIGLDARSLATHPFFALRAIPRPICDTDAGVGLKKPDLSADQALSRPADKTYNPLKREK
jgi:hypothetical protein